jgi:hypothetical protein
MTRTGVPNDEFHNLALEEGIYGIQTMEFDEFHPESGSPWHSESSRFQLGHSIFLEHSCITVAALSLSCD